MAMGSQEYDRSAEHFAEFERLDTSGALYSVHIADIAHPAPIPTMQGCTC